MAGFESKILLFALLLVAASARTVIDEAALLADECPEDDSGVPAAAIIDANDERFATFQAYSDNLEKWMNISIDPCNDFYGYTCQRGQADKLLGTMLNSELQDLMISLNALKNDAYFTNAAKPLKQLKHLYDKCVKPDTTDATITSSLKAKLQTLKSETGVNFPMLYQTERPTALNAANLGNLIGYPRNDFGLATLVQVDIDVDWKQPDEIPSRVYVDQASPMFLPEVYENWSKNKPSVVAQIEKDILALSRRFGLRIVGTALKADATAVAEMDYALSKYVTDDNTRRQYERSYNRQTIDDLQKASPAYNWINLIKSALLRAKAPERINAGLEVVVMEPEMIAKLSKDIAKKSAPFDTATVANYVFYRATQAMLDAAPPTAKLLLHSDEVEDQYPTVFSLEKFKRQPKRRVGGPKLRKLPKYEDLVKHFSDSLVTVNELVCVDFVRTIMPRAADRIFVDSVYPNSTSRADIRREVLSVAKGIFNGFRTQLNMLNWMSDESKKGAYQKLDNIQINIAYPDWVTDDAQLTAYYDGLSIYDASSTLLSYDAINDFALTQKVENFRLNNPRDRGDFVDTVGQTNANYQAEINAIGFFAGILHAPIYDPQQPTAVNFGGLGTVSGHELSHGFDDEGVQFDYIGALNAWMDAASSAEFAKMAQCVVNEYSGFCPDVGLCLNGANTQGENIGDNGGIQAAYKAFKASESYYGPDPRLPGFGSKFNNDQLFFISFANVWCEAPQDDEEYESDIETDPHAPAPYRVFGTIQNFPAFRSAFNCPVGTAYAPEDHCNVWTSPPAK